MTTNVRNQLNDAELAVFKTLTPKGQRALEALRGSAEGWPSQDSNDPSKFWASVYLDNAAFGTREEFAGVLSGLQKQGLYRPIDRYFGDVLVTQAEASAANTKFENFPT